MAGKFLTFKLTLVGKALAEYVDFYTRLNTQLEDEMTLDEFNAEIYKLGMSRMIQAITEVENENRFC